MHRNLFQRRRLGKHCSYFIPSPPLGDTGLVLPGEREPQQHDRKHNPPLQCSHRMETIPHCQDATAIQTPMVPTLPAKR